MNYIDYLFFFFCSIHGYSKGEKDNIQVLTTLILKQSNANSDTLTKQKIYDLLANYTNLETTKGIFGEYPLGYKKNL